MTVKDLRALIENLSDTVEVEVVMDSEHYAVSAGRVTQQVHRTPPVGIPSANPTKVPWVSQVVSLVRLYI